jgi:hypothetical protein
MDYLTSLVARNLELLEVIQPRLASRFEPSGLISGSLHGGSAWRDNAAEAQLASESTTTAHIMNTAPARRSEHPLESTRPSRGFQDEVSTRRPVQAHGQRTSKDATLPWVDAREKNAVQTRQDPFQAQLEHPPDAPSHPGNPRLAGRKTLPDFSPDQAGVMPPMAKNTTQTPASGSGQQNPGTASGQIIQPATAKHASPAEDGSGLESPGRPQLAKVAARPQVAPFVQAASAPIVEPASIPPTAPIIRVSIGRVEVRAVMAPQAPLPPRPQVRSGPSLSLEDYLKEREGGKR